LDKVFFWQPISYRTLSSVNFIELELESSLNLELRNNIEDHKETIIKMPSWKPDCLRSSATFNQLSHTINSAKFLHGNFLK